MTITGDPAAGAAILGLAASAGLLGWVAVLLLVRLGCYCREVLR